MTKNITCVTCPMGCPITVELNDNNEVISVTGNTCKRGEHYAKDEVTHPQRSLATTVRVEGGIHGVVPCKSAGPLPKEKIFECMEAVNAARVNAPVKLGDVLVADVCGTGVNIVATNHCPAK